jgi:hypothetical protein
MKVSCNVVVASSHRLHVGSWRLGLKNIGNLHANKYAEPFSFFPPPRDGSSVHPTTEQDRPDSLWIETARLEELGLPTHT